MKEGLVIFPLNILNENKRIKNKDTLIVNIISYLACIFLLKNKKYYSFSFLILLYMPSAFNPAIKA